MALYRYFQRKDFERPALPTVSMCASSLLSQAEVERANDGVSRVMSERYCGKAPTNYNEYTAEVRAQIGKYAAENGPTRAARYFSERLNLNVPETSARRFKSDYLQRLKSAARDAESVVTSLPTKTRGRPLLLGKDLDKAVQDYITALRTVGGVVNSTIVVAAAEGIVSARDVTMLRSHGGHIHINKT